MRDDARVASVVDGSWPRWRREHEDIRAAHKIGRDLVARLQQLVVQQDRRWGREIAAAVEFADYLPAVTRPGKEHPAWLWVVLPPHLQEQVRGRYRQKLGAQIRFEEDGRGT